MKIGNVSFNIMTLSHIVLEGKTVKFYGVNGKTIHTPEYESEEQAQGIFTQVDSYLDRFHTATDLAVSIAKSAIPFLPKAKAKKVDEAEDLRLTPQTAVLNNLQKDSWTPLARLESILETLLKPAEVSNIVQQLQNEGLVQVRQITGTLTYEAKLA